MYRVEFCYGSYIESKRYSTDFPEGIERPEGYNGVTSLVCVSFHPVGNSVHCMLENGMIFTIPVNSFVRFTHIFGTPEYPETETGGYLYHQFDHDTKTPTGFASGDSYYLSHWLMDGYDVVIEESDKYGNISTNYITTSISK